MVWRKMATSSASASRAGHSGEAVSGTSPFRKRSILAPFKAGLDLSSVASVWIADLLRLGSLVDGLLKRRIWMTGTTERIFRAER